MRKFGLVFKFAVVVFALYAAITLLTLQIQINDKRTQAATLKDELAWQEKTHAALTEATASEPTPEQMARIAREKLGLVLPGERVFIDVSH